jgi:hypothetical protein
MEVIGDFANTHMDSDDEGESKEEIGEEAKRSLNLAITWLSIKSCNSRITSFQKDWCR